ncbi:MAG: DUF3102 domain-containing protein [Ruminococcus sp.]|nr:DUF3102 domain-containing protein [Ruminococcus sp.]
MIQDISKASSPEELGKLLDPPPVAAPAAIEETMPPMARAAWLTERIKANGQTAVNAVWAIGRDLRTMKVEELYVELDYETFEEYAEKEFSLKRRQAYTYISVYEKLGQNELVQSTAQLGITKLALLTTVDAEDRAEILEKHDVAGMTTKELEKLLADYKQQGEQLSMLEEKVEEMEAVRMDTNALIDKAEELEGERDELAAKVNELKKAVRELEAAKGEPEVVEKIVEKEVVKEVSDTQELDLARQLQKEAEKKAEKAEERATGAEKKLDSKHKALVAAENKTIQAQKEIQDLKAELERVRAEAQKPADSGDKSNFKAAYAASYKELTGLLELISATEDKQERQIFQAKTEQLLALVGEKLKAIEGADSQ